MYEVYCWIHVNMKVFQFVGYIKYWELFGGKLFFKKSLICAKTFWFILWIKNPETEDFCR